MLKTTNKKIRKGLYSGLFVVVLLFGLVYFIGFHNSDNCQNYDRINAVVKQYNISFAENGLIVKSQNTLECYINGEYMQVLAFSEIFFICLILLKNK